MSGRKTAFVRIEESEWRRAQRAAARLRDVQSDLPQVIEGVREQARRDAQQAADEIQRRQRSAERTIDQLSSRARELESEVNRRLDEQARQMFDSLDSTATQVRDEARKALAERERALRSAVAQERRRRERDVSELRGGLAELAADRKRAVEAASRWVRDAHAVRDLIRETLPFDRYAPGRLEALERDLAAVGDVLDAGLGEAALAGAQRAYHGLSDLRVELEWADREWHLLRAAARDALLVVQGLIEHNADRAAVDADGEELPDVPLEVDYWSNGALSRLRAEVAATLGLLVDEASPPSTDTMRELVDQRAPAFERRLAEIVEEAGLAQLGSQLRANIADIVVRTLVDNGFSLADATYGGEDYRNAFFAKVEHPDGGEVVVDVSPSTAGPAACELKVLSYDRDTGSEEIREARARELAAALREHGLDAGVPQPAGGEPDARYRDIESIRRAAPQAGTDAPQGRPAGAGLGKRSG
ncbi:hypothetical protein [Frankia sp. CiP1_Cm_nod1]|uniref:hypothetical protein n=1 Tax=Frankia sp. CiP1_Cm_nod1 TaxID=2897160 RepID=UPI0020247EB8